MIEFITAAFAPVNVLFTVLLLVTGLYWIMVILGVLDIDLFHIHLPEGGLDADADMDAGGDIGHAPDIDGVEPGAVHSVLHFFYIGEIPTMSLVSIMTLSLWTFSILGNYYLNPEGSGSMSIAILCGNIAISTVVLKFVAMPLRTLFLILNKDYNAPGDVMGSTCRIVTTEVTREESARRRCPRKERRSC